MITTILSQQMMLPVSLPLLAGLVCLLLPRRADGVRATLAVAVTAVVVVLSWLLFRQSGVAFDPVPWLSLRLDALSGFVLLAVACFGLFIAIYSVGYMKGRQQHREYFTYLLWTLGMSCGVIIANDLLLLLVCWGFLGLVLYLMIGLAGPEAAEAARKSLMIIGGSDALLLLGIVFFWHLSGTLRMDVAALGLDSPAAYVAFLAFVAAALAKAGAVPFHSWVPDFGEHADAPVSAFLPASLDKLLGIYLLARCVLDLFVPTPAMYMILMLLGAVTVIAAAMMALVQHDLKRLLSFSTISQVGYMVLGIGSGTAIGLAGGLFHMLNHALYKCALFLCAGAVEKETGSTDLDRLGGLSRLMPVTFIAFTIAALANAGIPPLNGFASKWMVYQGIITSGGTGGLVWILWLAAAMLGSALTLAVLMKALHATFLCKPSPEIRSTMVNEAKRSMLVPLIALPALCVIFGVFAFAVPLDRLIFPVVQVDVPGVWWAGLATTLIIVAILVGLVIYWVTMRSGKLRRTRTYIGGERLQDIYVSGSQTGPGRHLEVTGIDFYDTIEQLPMLRRIYPLARARVFDMYDIMRKGASFFVLHLRGVHTGILPVYLTWILLGMLVVVWSIMQTGR
jgi:formate hydrogenlyase subunit 3/multisubunit Na+/H+ antiporter MnhD subunit